MVNDRNQILVQGTASDVVNIPFEYGKIQVQQRMILKGETKKPGPLSTLIQIWKSGDIRNIYKQAFIRGSKLQIMRDSIGCGMYFMCHQTTLKYYTPDGKSRNNASQFGVFMASIAAGSGYWILSYPIDVIKTRVQSEDPSKKALSSMQHVRNVYSQGGVRYFYKGFSIALTRSVIVNIFALDVYENLHRMAYAHI